MIARFVQNKLSTYRSSWYMKALYFVALRDCVIIQKYIYRVYLWRRGGLMVSALDSGASGLGSSPGRGHCAVFLGRHLTLTVPLSTQVYKWVSANCWGNLTNCGGVTCDELASRPGEVEILLSAS